ncbi:cadherin repeat domain-containing protein [Photobacterium sanguinicancri]|uniref:cadherin repeat domain-containing protein n=1 Tax=Photobacterium sanguinicancri TaxID=875932 RepID=UPI0026E25E93|nr:cadherin repeat domain-containing protein [Photobacterium sanguinicancri]MDO6500521.1 cadherin repeat domain-containing protein [Photobacterium sanguinicancri]
MKKIYLALCISASLVLTGCGGGESSSENSSSVQAPAKKKAARDPLMAQDVNMTYYDSGQYQPIVNNTFGDLSYRLADGEPNDVVMINKQTGVISFLNPGDVTIVVEDTSSVYQTSTDTFTVHIEQATNSDLHADYQTIPTLSTKKIKLPVSGKRGELIYSVAPDSQYLLAIDSNTGEMTPQGGEGIATVIIKDMGNRRYLPTSKEVQVRIKAIAPGELSFEDINKQFTRNMILEPRKLSGGEEGELSYSIAYQNPKDGVLTIDPKTGFMDVSGVGEAKIKVTQDFSGGYSVTSQEEYFDVNISQGERQLLVVDKISDVYVKNERKEVIARNAIDDLSFEVLSGNSIEIDSHTGEPKIVGVGTSIIKATDDKNKNFKPSSTTFEYTIERGTHPGIVQKKIETEFSDVNTKFTPHLDGQQGVLTISAPTSNNVVEANGNELTIKHAGTVKLQVTDNGGDFYHPTMKEVQLVISPATHPKVEVKGSVKVYSDGLSIPQSKLVIKGIKEELLSNITITPLDSDTNAAVKYESANKRFVAQKAGTARFAVTDDGNTDYKPFEPAEFAIVIQSADSTLTVEPKEVDVVFSPGLEIKAPQVNGAKGALTFSFADGEEKDVVTLGSKGALKVLRAGQTILKVTSASTSGFKAATVLYPVKIKKAVNPVAVSYPTKTYKKGDSITPVKDNVESILTYNVKNNGAVVSLINANTGEVRIESAGKYEIEVTAQSSSKYQSKSFFVQGEVKKAKHPGIAYSSESFEFEPLKKVTPTFTQPLGKRSYDISNKPRDLKQPLDNNTGELTLVDYFSESSMAAITLSIAEEESDNYLALDSKTGELGKKTIHILPPKLGSANNDMTINSLSNIIYSSDRVNGSKFRNLQDLEVRFAGVVKQLPANQELKDKHGDGVRLLTTVKPVGSKDASEQRQAMVYVQRYEGCNLKHSEMRNSIVNVKDGDYCKYTGFDTKRYLSFVMIGADKLSPGQWESVTPFVFYYYSPREFAATDFGGLYTDGGAYSHGQEKPSHVIEWNRVDLNFTID